MEDREGDEVEDGEKDLMDNREEKPRGYDWRMRGKSRYRRRGVGE